MGCGGCKGGLCGTTIARSPPEPSSPFNPFAAKATATGNPMGGKATSGAPFRHPLEWQDPSFYDEKALDQEMRRVFDVCHGCRLCFSLCNSFPRLFELIDGSKTQELDSVPSEGFKKVVDDCTLCDMCFIAKCPYVPPHPFNIDFPHLMLRYRAVENKNKNLPAIEQKIGTELPSQGSKESNASKSQHVGEGVSTKLNLQPPDNLMVDMNKVSPIGSTLASIVNWGTKTGAKPRLLRKIMETTANIHHRADLPKYVPRGQSLLNQFKGSQLKANPEGPLFGKRKVLIYATCIGNWNKPSVGLGTEYQTLKVTVAAAAKVLAHNGAQVEVAYPSCCGMPQLESGNLRNVAEKAKTVSAELNKYIDQNYDIVTCVASCTLMLKQEWPNILPKDESIKKLSSKTFDISEYLVNASKKEVAGTVFRLTLKGLLKVPHSLPHSVSLHHACHARAQNMGFKSRELLNLIPNIDMSVIERCSGHGGSFGVKKETHPIALAVGKPVFNKVKKEWDEDPATVVSSDCPLAADHIQQGVRNLSEKSENQEDIAAKHPVELLALAYKL